MNTLGTAAVWGVMQVTLFSMIATAAYALVRRRGPAAGALAATASLTMAMVVTLLAFSPWPGWLCMAAPAAAESENGANDDQAAAADARGNSSGEATGTATKTQRPIAGANSAGEAWNAFWQELRHAPTTAAPTAWRWPAIVGVVIGAGAIVAMLRMLMGIAAVRRYRAATELIDEPKLGALAVGLARHMGCRRPIELRQSRVLTTPATVGWRRPLVVLPDGWRDWTETERRVVLAHEIAHVGRGDYAAWLLAQLSLALHFYHPLVHWLVRRLRLEQELAADAWGAEASGGRETYLMTLAQMALRQDDRAIAWAARPFLPDRGTFLRRIEMLRDPKQLRYTRSSWRRKTGLVSAMALAGLLIAGVRGPVAENESATKAAEPKTSTATTSTATTNILKYVPHDAAVVFSVRPAATLEQVEMKPLADMFNEQLGLQATLGAPLEEIDEIMVVAARFPDPKQGPPPAFPELIIWRSRGPHDWNALKQRFVPDGTDATFGKFEYLKAKEAAGGRAGYCGFTPDDRTLVLAAEPLLQRALLAASKPVAGKPEWLDAWQEISQGHAALMVDMQAIHRVIALELKEQAPPNTAAQAFRMSIAPFSPLWEDSTRLLAGVEVGNGVNVRATFECATPESAERVRATADAALTLARNMLDNLGEPIATAPGELSGPALIVTDLAGTLAKQAKLTADGSSIHLRTEAQLDVADTGIAALVPAVMAARQAAQRAQAMNNLKQIALAFHNYHDVYGHFPAASVIGPDGKTPHSWRVAILPYIEQAAMYNQYKLDEPWDSENNEKLLAQLPVVLRDPNGNPASTSSPYFMLTGDSTIGGSKEGVKIQDIRDGTSNTILVVEAKRDVPWTKPEDIAYDPAKPLPKLGGWRPNGFLASLADGSVRFISDTTDEKTLRALITKAGGEVIPLP